MARNMSFNIEEFDDQASDRDANAKFSDVDDEDQVDSDIEDVFLDALGDD